MTSLFERRSHKPTRFGEAQVLSSVEDVNTLFRGSYAGVDIYTDDTDLSKQLELVGSTSIIDQPLSLVYFVNSPLPLTDKKGGIVVAPMDPDFAGEMYTDYSLRNFGFSGIPSFGTLIHIVYGIRTLEGLNNNSLGLHSAVVYDRHQDGCHILVGPSKAGKSTIANELVGINSDRFYLLSDDWSEVNFDDITVHPVSEVFVTPDEAKDNEPDFTSFGKDYFLRDSHIQPDWDMRVLSLTELYKAGVSGEDDFFTKTFSPVPFIISRNYNRLTIPDLHEGNAQSHLVQLVEYKMMLFRQMYKDLRNNVRLQRIENDQSLSPVAIASKLLDIN